MSDDARVDELVDRWERLRDRGETVSAEELCADCPTLLDEVRRRFRALEAMDRLLNFDAAGRASAPPRDGAPAGTVVGAGAGSRYRPLRLHARGGLGEVFVAHDEELNREVALKRVQEPHAHRAESRRRFLLEAEVTGRLEHPGIVPVYGLGQDADGRPVYAMRFVRGDTLEEAIRRHHDADRPGRDPGERAVSLRELLGRFRAVCQTVAFAHSRGMLHRDLKPANIMLGGYGETLVMDWGLARPLDHPGAADDPTGGDALPADGSGTRTGDVIGTPAYMSPEQARGSLHQLGPASDIHGLGATLYAVITGRAPFDGAHVREVVDRAARGDFPPPRAVKPDVSRPLEAICLKAMALRPEDRYTTALELADDVDRWIAGEPVSAWREPWPVRARRWVGRHRTLVTTASAAVLVAAVSLAVAAVLLARANTRERSAKELAERRRAEARAHFRLARDAVERYFARVSQDKLLDVPRMHPLRRDLLQIATEFHEKFLAEAGDDPEVRSDRAEALAQLAGVKAVMGEKAAAIELFRQAASAFEELADADPTAELYQERLANCHNDLGALYLKLGRHAEAEAAFKKSLAISQRLAADHPDDPLLQQRVAERLMNLGAWNLDGKKLEIAGKMLGEALALHRQLVVDDQGSHKSRHALARCLVNRGVWHREAGEPGKARRDFEEARDLCRQLVKEEPRQMYREDLAGNYLRLAKLAQTAGPVEEVVPGLRAARDMFQTLADEFETPHCLEKLAECLDQLGRLYHHGEPDLAADSYRRAVIVYRKLEIVVGKTVDNRRLFADCLNNLGLLYHHTHGRFAEARPYYEEALEVARWLAGQKKDPEFPRLIGRIHHSLGQGAAQGKDAEAALGHYSAAIDTLEQADREYRPDPRATESLLNVSWRRALLLSELKRHPEALADWDRAIKLAPGPKRNDLLAERAMTLARMGEYVRAAGDVERLSSLTPPVTGSATYRLAATCAVSSAAARGDAVLPPVVRAVLAEHYAGRAVDLLERLRDAGYFKDPAKVSRLKGDPDLAQLRGRADYARRMGDLR